MSIHELRMKCIKAQKTLLSGQADADQRIRRYQVRVDRMGTVALQKEAERLLAELRQRLALATPAAPAVPPAVRPGVVSAETPKSPRRTSLVVTPRGVERVEVEVEIV